VDEQKLLNRRIDAICELMAAEQEEQESESNNKPVNVSEWARRHQVPYQRLNARWNGRGSLFERPATNSRLSEEQQRALLQYCKLRELMGMPVPLKTLHSVAESILRRSLSSDEQENMAPLGDRWAKRFMAKHKLKKTKQKPIELARKEAHSPTSIRQWFAELERTLRKYNIRPQNLWNFDETGFRIGIGGSQWVITMDPKRRAWSPSDTSRKHVTAIEAVSATGEVIEPMLVIVGAVLQERWFEDLSLSDNTLFGVSDTSYVNDELALEWIKHFEQQTKPIDCNEYRLLVCDNYSSHVFLEFLEFAQEHQIIVIGLPSHTSHFLQPLDVVLFQPYKHYHKEAVLQATQTGCTNFTIMEFLAKILAFGRRRLRSTISAVVLGQLAYGLWM
jgi:hypothetical protein